MQTFQQDFAGASIWRLHVPGNYLTILQCNLAVNVRLYKNGLLLPDGESRGFLAGLEVGPLAKGLDGSAAFDYIEIDVAGADTVKIGVGDGSARYNRSQGSVTVTNTAGAFVDSQKSVTNADQVLLAANANRRYLMIQNNSVQVLRVTMDGSVATETKGKRIQSGQFLELQGYVATTAMRGFMELADATANNVDITEG